MSDNKKIQDGRDDSKIDATDPSEIGYAAEEWSVSREAVRNAIQQVGTSRRKVREYLVETKQIAPDIEFSADEIVPLE